MTHPTPDPPASPPGLQDDRALQYFLTLKDSPLAFQQLYRVAKNKLLGPKGHTADDQQHVDLLAETVATVVDIIRDHTTTNLRVIEMKELDEKAPSSALEAEEDELARTVGPLHIWSLLTDVLKALSAEAGTALPSATVPDYPYFARDVLLGCFAEDRKKTVSVLVKAYRFPAYSLLQKKKWSEQVDFADAYQEASINLGKTSFDPKQKHTAQLFSVFFTMLVRRSLDQLRTKDRQKRVDDNFGKISVPERHDYAAYGDYMNEELKLGELFGKDKLEHIFQDALATLGKECHKLLYLLFYQEYSYKQVAEVMKIKANGVGTRRERCLRKLGKNLNPGQS